MIQYLRCFKKNTPTSPRKKLIIIIFVFVILAILVSIIYTPVNNRIKELKNLANAKMLTEVAQTIFKVQGSYPKWRAKFTTMGTGSDGTRGLTKETIHYIYVAAGAYYRYFEYNISTGIVTAYGGSQLSTPLPTIKAFPTPTLEMPLSSTATNQPPAPSLSIESKIGPFLDEITVSGLQPGVGALVILYRSGGRYDGDYRPCYTYKLVGSETSVTFDYLKDEYFYRATQTVNGVESAPSYFTITSW